MQNTDPPRVIQIPVAQVNALDLSRQLADENFRLRQITEEMANRLAIQQELMQQLRDEIARLKGQKPKPKIPPSKLEGPRSKPDWRQRVGPHDPRMKSVVFPLWVGDSMDRGIPALRRSFSTVTAASILQKRSSEISLFARKVIKRVRIAGKPGQPRGKLRKKKKTVLEIHASPVIYPANVPDGATFKGFCRYTVQEIIFEPHNIQYHLARWQLPDGSYITGELPKEVHGHYGPQLVTYILHQYHACRVTEPLLLDQLHAVGILISAGQLNNILIENKESFIEEVAELLPVAARIEEQLQTDDTGGRHNGQNQYTTIIGNRWFSIFATTDSKSRVNFLKLLQNGKEEYVINEDALDYLSQVNVPDYLPGYVSLYLGSKFTTLMEWEQFLEERNIVRDIEVRFLTEAALYASVIQNGIPRNLGVHSDDAGQFDVFIHSLCWVHEERHYRKLIMTTDESRAELERVLDQIWSIYRALKRYKDTPSKGAAKSIEKEFGSIFQQKTSSPVLNRQLEKSGKKKEELLRVLQRPDTPLHNNSSETCARAAKIKLKISGGTRSKVGQKVRDTFLSLKQTCRKLEISFMSFLQDRVRGKYKIPRLATIIRERALAVVTGPPNLPLPSSNLAVLQLDYQQLAG
ncbi:MAG: transposase [Sedimentisphaerales bacterium]